MAKKAVCGHCKSENVYGMSRVVGYYSIVENWNESKQAELKDRQKGVYKIEDDLLHKEAVREEALAFAR